MNSNRYNWLVEEFTFLILALIIIFTFYGCTGSRAENGSAMPPASRQSVQKVTLVEVSSAPIDYENKVVIISGVFKGWKGKCQSSFPVTRSDWILDDGVACIYVSGKLPTGASAFNPNNERLTVTGEIMIDEGGSVNLKAMEVIEEP